VLSIAEVFCQFLPLLGPAFAELHRLLWHTRTFFWAGPILLSRAQQKSLAA
jgi:hypothetical protein